MSDLHRINGRWLDSPTANLCVHRVSRSEKCERRAATQPEELYRGAFSGSIPTSEPLVPESDHNRVVAELEAKHAGAEQRAAAYLRERDAARSERDTVAKTAADALEQRQATLKALTAAQERIAQFEGGAHVSPPAAPQSQSSSTKKK